ncbi:conserved hypothetical protein [Xenorhabdus bovienii str. oregonense]|uniref:DUF2335 domain-containing protein n=1 Tax=Xenorhabdus bovienii str. oregonense TaxID=1398202 RepID=A0A077P7D3_XENBV|nr:DUF2335 domain-containing protein [Xenorhabdus bovienii]CDH05681.1 conserved hypothetical protein [Xenorhabdus bovienii str. oregonense]
MGSNIYHYFRAIGSILDIMPANDYREILDSDLSDRNSSESQVISRCSEPLPSPDVLKNYESILSGCAERILSFREKEQRFRHDNQKKALDSMITKDKRGQWMGFSIAMFILTIATIFAFKGEMLFAGTLITIDLVGLAAVFAIGRKSNIK